MIFFSRRNKNKLSWCWINSKVWVKKRANVKKLAIKNSTYFVLFSWNLVKMITSRGNYFRQILLGLDKKYGSFTNGQFLNMGPFFYSDFVIDFSHWREKLLKNIYSILLIAEMKGISYYFSLNHCLIWFCCRNE